MNANGVALLCVVLVLAAFPSTAVTASDVPESAVASDAPPADSPLRAAERDLTAGRLRAALEKIRSFLSDPGRTEEERLDALVLRCRTHVARRDWKAAERDFREVLSIRPGFVPAESEFAPGARSRFERIRTTMVGGIRLELHPPDAAVTVDGRPTTVGPDGAIPLLAGVHTVRAALDGFDPEEVAVEVIPDRIAPAVIRLVPNGRDIVVRTELDEVTVTFDGLIVGPTRRSDGAPPESASELRIAAVAPGEHRIELSKPCYRPAALGVLLTIDLLDPSPQIYGPVSLEPLRARLALEGGADGAEVFVNGSRVGTLPLPVLGLCPGPARVEVRAHGRVVWRSDSVLEADQATVIEVKPRPNLVGVAEELLDPSAREWTSSFNRVATLPAPSGDGFETGDGLALFPDLPKDADLVLASRRAVDGAVVDAFVFSPILRVVAPFAAGTASHPPRGRRATLGFRLVDSRMGGPARVVAVSPGGPAASAGVVPGDRVVALDGILVTTARGALDAIESRDPGTRIVLRLQSASGREREVACTARGSAFLPDGGLDPLADIVLAAWARMDAAVRSEPLSSDAWATLGVILSRHGRSADAESAWREVRWGDRTGLGDGTAAFYRGIELLRQGRLRESAELMRAAAASSATSSSDDGPEVAPAARDCLREIQERSATAGGSTAR